MISAASHYPDYARELANHDARIESVEKRQDGFEKRFDKLLTLIICTLIASVGGLLGILVQLLRHA